MSNNSRKVYKEVFSYTYMFSPKYVSGRVLAEIDALKAQLDTSQGEKAVKLHNQKKAALQNDALNTSLYLEYPEFRPRSRHQPGRFDREAKKLLKRLEGAWCYCINITEDTPLSIRDLEVIQGIIVEEGDLGLRKGDVEIKGKLPFPPYESVPAYLADALKNAENMRAQAHPVEIAAYTHLHIAYVHPFMDGNGRTARMIQNYELHKQGYPPTVIRPPERELYFSLLENARAGITEENKKPQQPFFEFIAAKVQEGLEHILEKQ
jgi:prophage maintenance system killer protein